MSWVFTAVAALLGAAAGSAGMFLIASACVKWYNISSFEGKSGYFVVLLMLAGIIGGLILALVAARLGHAFIAPAWYVQLLAAIATVALALLGVLGACYLKADRVPELGGRGLSVAWEVRLPATNDEFGPRGDPAEWPDSELRLQLVSVVRHQPRGHAEAAFDRAAFRRENGQWVLPARVPLFTSKGEFCVNLTLGGRDDGFWPLLPRFPQESHFEWSPWYRTNKGRDKSSDAEAVMYRFRFERE